MTTELRLIQGGPDEKGREPLEPEERLRVFRRMAATMARDALSAWSDVYREFEGKVASGTSHGRGQEGLQARVRVARVPGADVAPGTSPRPPEAHP